jgi:hypothetical protein
MTLKNDLNDLKFINFDKLFLPDNNEVKKIKSLYQREVEYIAYLGLLEFFIANYGIC